mmetsp:Transcript_63382/g.141179  ORF Transcript_63382/g.141179 Transcript_63382/m.141179 type:complete len:286 (+) Transcript_63382:3-860(+)
MRVATAPAAARAPADAPRAHPAAKLADFRHAALSAFPASALPWATVAAAVASGRRQPRGRGCGTFRPRVARQAFELRLPELLAEEAQKLSEGQRVQRQDRTGNAGHGFVVVDVAAPPSLIMGCLESFEDYPSMIPVVREVEVLSKGDAAEGPTARCSYRISKFWLGIDAHHRLDRSAGKLTFELDKSGPRLVLREATGYWLIQELTPETSRVWLCVTSLRASPFVPKCIIEYAADRALRRATCWLKPVLEERWQQQRPTLESGSSDKEAAPLASTLPMPSAYCAA